MLKKESLPIFLIEKICLKFWYQIKTHIFLKTDLGFYSWKTMYMFRSENIAGNESNYGNHSKM